MIRNGKSVLAALLACLALLTGALALAEDAPIAAMPNPMREVTPEEITEALGVEVKLPADAENPAYFLYDMVDYQMGEIQFDAFDVHYNYRFNPAEAFEDNSGMFYGDLLPAQEVVIGDIDGELYIVQEGLAGYVLWYDDGNAMMYSISATDGADGLSLVALANEMFL